MKYYTLLVTVKYDDGRVCKHRFGMSRNEFSLFHEKVLKPKGVVVLNIEDIKEPMKYYS